MILFERGSIVDEYLSVPEFYGPLPPGDVVGLAANPRVVNAAHRRRSRGRATDRTHRARRPPTCRRHASCSPSSPPRSGSRARARLGGRARARRRRQGGAGVKVAPAARLAARRADVGAPGRARSREADSRPIAPRLYGRGPSIDGWAAQLLRDDDGPFVAVGASMGGYCALALARRAPERVVGMALVGSRADADSWDRRRYREDQIAELRSDNARPQVYGEPTNRGPRRRTGGDARPPRPHGRRRVVRRPDPRLRRRPRRASSRSTRR